MNKFKYQLYRFFLKIKGSLLFLFFFLFPQIIASIIFISIKQINKIYNIRLIDNILKDEVFILIIISYLSFYALFFITFTNSKKTFYFFDNEEWITSFGNALIPTIIAFGSAYTITFFFIFLTDKIPFPNDLKSWINSPNLGITEISIFIDNKEYIKVLVLFFIIIVFTPIFEEIVFRGFLQGSMEKFFKKYNLDIIIVALIFGLFHYQSLSNIIFSFILGLYLSIEKKKHKSINVSIWMHGIVNFTGLLTLIIFKYLNLSDI